MQLIPFLREYASPCRDALGLTGTAVATLGRGMRWGPNNAIEAQNAEVVFYSESEDITDELRAFLETLRPQLQDRWGTNDPDNVGIVSVNFLGRQYKLSDQISIGPDFVGLELANFAFAAAPSSNWASVDAMLKIGASSGSNRAVRIGLRDYTLNANRLTSGVRFCTTTANHSDNGWIANFTGYGIKADVSNRRIHIARGTLQEWGPQNVTGKTWANRTGIGLWIEKSDGIAEGVVMPCCKHGLFVTNIRNFLLQGVHPWMGALTNEAERVNAHCVVVGPVDVTGEGDAEGGSASGLQLTECYFDNGSVKMTDSFGHQFDSCNWVKGDNLYPMVLETSTADQTGVGLKLADARISRLHNRDFFQYATTGAGSWADRKLIQYTVVSAGTDEVLPTKLMSSLWMLDSGANSEPTPSGWDNLARVQASDHPVEIPVAGRIGQFVAHSPYPGTGATFTQWGATSKPPSVWGAASRSTVVGTFGGFPLTGDVLFRIGGTGDNGTDFGTTTKPGGSITITAGGDWSATSTPTRIKVQTTAVGATGDSRDVWSFMPNGNLRPETNGAEVGESDAPTKTVRTKAAVLHTVGSAPSAVSEGVQLFFDGTNLKAVLPGGAVKTITWV